MTSDQRYLDFIRSSCDALGVGLGEVLGKGRGSRPVVRARQAIAYAMRGRYDLSYPHMGRLLKREHTTLISSVRVVAAALRAGAPWAVETVGLLEPHVLCCECSACLNRGGGLRIPGAGRVVAEELAHV